MTLPPDCNKTPHVQCNGDLQKKTVEMLEVQNAAPVKPRPSLASYGQKIIGHKHKQEVNLKKKNEKKSFRWWYSIYVFGFFSLVVCLLQIILPPPFGLRQTSDEVAQQPFSNGCADGMATCICPRETICADSPLYMVLLALARCTAFFDYPLYMMMFLSKAHNVNNILRRTVLREWIDFGDMHKVHKLFGIVVGIETMSHSFFHLLRWGLRGDMDLLGSTATGVSGLIAMFATPLIAWPMVVPFLKKNFFSFEARKGLHFLSWVWALALCYHAPSRIYLLIGVPALIYLIDSVILGFYMRTNLIESAFFERYGEKGVVLYFENPKGCDFSKTSYVYIMCPWLSKLQWHAFSAFPDPVRKGHTMLCIGASGDWTKEMHERIHAPCIKPIYVMGPFMSEFSDDAVTTSNAIAVASGIGITPTLSMMNLYGGKKRINVVWACRDAGLIEYFLHKVDLSAITSKAYFLIFYTGKRDLVLPDDLPINFFIFRSRPKLEEVISGIVAAIESGEGLPEEIYKEQQALADKPFEERIKAAIGRVVTMYSVEEMFEYAVEMTEEEVPISKKDEETGETEFLNEKQHLDVSNTSRFSTASRHLPGKNLVSSKGLKAMIESFLGGIGEYSDSDLDNLFRQVDEDDSGFIDKSEFDQFVSMIVLQQDPPKARERNSLKSMKSIRPGLSRRFSNESMLGFAESTRGLNSFGGADTMDYMANLKYEKEKPLKDWCMFYCGGSAPVVKDLKKIRNKYDIPLSIEKFDW